MIKIFRDPLFRLAGGVFLAFLSSCSSGSSSTQNGGGIQPPPPPPSSFQMSVTVSGLGSGQVISSPTGINCQSRTTCSETYASGTVVNLTASATESSSFVGWAGACTGSAASCNLPINTNESASAIFSPGSAISILGISAGFSHTCITFIMTLQNYGACFGDDTFGELGDGTNDTSFAPVYVAGGSDGPFAAISAGGYHTCWVIPTNAEPVQCWGDNAYGELGNGSLINSNVPVSMTANSPIQISSGGYHSCALITGGAIQCWGDNTYGQLGYLSSSTYSSTPVSVTGIPLPSGTQAYATAISTGSRHTCAAMSDGTVQCWGDNTYGQLGVSLTTTFSATPVAVYGMTSSSSPLATNVTAGDRHTCAAMTDGTVQCWGDNTYDQLGNGTSVSNSYQPVSVSGSANVSVISAGADHTCAVFMQTMQCWGANSFGQLGNNSTTNSPVPVTVGGLSTGLSFIATGRNHTCAVLSSVSGDGVMCWGDNSSGQLGFVNSSTTSYSTPQSVSGL